ncbi:MAG: hypothetical protein LAP85_20255 [Acidobacteriia bacterium]|nr:hypothetical protein [Terriglobia bacterium]
MIPGLDLRSRALADGVTVIRDPRGQYLKWRRPVLKPQDETVCATRRETAAKTYNYTLKWTLLTL